MRATLDCTTKGSQKLPLIGSTHSKTLRGNSSETILSKQQVLNPYAYFCVREYGKYKYDFWLSPAPWVIESGLLCQVAFQVKLAL